jgi:MscS family membrane protein
MTGVLQNSNSYFLALSAPAGILHRLRQDFVATTLTGWIVLAAAIFVGVVAGKVVQVLLGRLSERFKAHGAEATAATFNSAASPASLALLAVGLGVGLTVLLSPAGVDPRVRAFAFAAVGLLLVLSLAWVAYRLVEVVDILLLRLTARTAGSLDNQLVPLIRKSLRIFIIAVFALFIAQNFFNADISAWLAGLGIAGLAVSLAAQDSIKNLFGSVTILLDHPFRLGDSVTFDGKTGAVEEIGFRSTRLRTADGHLVTIPNSKIVDSAVENISRRNSIRRVFDLHLAYDTPPEKIEQAIRILRDILNDPQCSGAFDMKKTPPRIYFDQFNPDSLNIKAFYWFTPTDYWAYMEHAHELNVKLLKEYAAAGIRLVPPTQILQTNPAKAPPAK